MAKKAKGEKVNATTKELFSERCVHCEHYQETVGKCCFCERLNLPEANTRPAAEHRAEIEKLLENEIEI